ncbi:DUF4190 domain-containing protein [Pseudonocardia sp.]|uniref:DUF4190 domain-containing protein n=1 Tax=Pseudonocardia sp. TaxID=60912 RepID=UPI00341B9708
MSISPKPVTTTAPGTSVTTAVVRSRRWPTSSTYGGYPGRMGGATSSPHCGGNRGGRRQKGRPQTPAALARSNSGVTARRTGTITERLPHTSGITMTAQPPVLPPTPTSGPTPYRPASGAFQAIPTTRQTSISAVNSLVAGLTWWFWVGSIAAVVLGHIARKECREQGYGGDSLGTSAAQSRQLSTFHPVRRAVWRAERRPEVHRHLGHVHRASTGDNDRATEHGGSRSGRGRDSLTSRWVDSG